MRCKLDDIFVFPAAADNGIAAGCALWAYDTIGGGTERPKLNIATLGRTHGSDEIEQTLTQNATIWSLWRSMAQRRCLKRLPKHWPTEALLRALKGM